MAGPYSIFFDPSKDPGSKMAPEVAAEIAVLAPSTVTDGSISTEKLAEQAVTTVTIADQAVTAAKIADGGVGTTQLAPEAVTGAKIADDTITPTQTGTGVVTAVDSANAVVACTVKFVTAAQYSGLTPDANTLYFVSA